MCPNPIFCQTFRDIQKRAFTAKETFYSRVHIEEMLDLLYLHPIEHVKSLLSLSNFQNLTI